jgi:hypothetical protein
LHVSQSDWSRRRHSCGALAPGGANIIAVSCTAAFGVSIVAGLSRDDFTQIARGLSRSPIGETRRVIAAAQAKFVPR